MANSVLGSHSGNILQFNGKPLLYIPRLHPLPAGTIRVQFNTETNPYSRNGTTFSWPGTWTRAMFDPCIWDYSYSGSDWRGMVRSTASAQDVAWMPDNCHIIAGNLSGVEYMDEGWGEVGNNNGHGALTIRIENAPDLIVLGGGYYSTSIRVENLASIERLDFHDGTNGSLALRYASFDMPGNGIITSDYSGGHALFTGAFRDCEQLLSVTGLKVSGSAQTLKSLFSECFRLQSVEILGDTSSVTDFSEMFQNCYALQHAPELNTASATTLARMFLNCETIDNVPLFNVENVTNMDSTFNGCSAVTHGTYALYEAASQSPSNPSHVSTFQNCGPQEDAARIPADWGGTLV